MKINNIFNAFFLASGILASSAALANPLTIVNNTSEFSTSVTNNTFCSSRIPGGSGITKPHSTNVVSDFSLRLACTGHLDNCKSEVYMTDNCTGPKVAEVDFSVYTGIKNVIALDPRYNMTGTGFNAQIDYKN